MLAVFSMVYLAGSFLGSVSCSLTILKIVIFLIGIGIGHSSVVSKLLIYTETQNNESKTIVSYAVIAFFSTWAPAWAMYIGGHISYWTNWRVIFVGLTITGIFLLVITIKVSMPQHKNYLPTKKLLNGYWYLLKEPQIIVFLFGLSALASGPIIFYINGIYLFKEKFKLPLFYFGHLIFILVAFNLIGKLISAKIINHITDTKILVIYSLWLFTIGIIGNYYATIHFNPIMLVIMVSLYMMALGGIISISRIFLFKQSNEYTSYMSSLVSL